MQVYDKVNKTELTADTEELIKLMAPGGRQVDLYLKEKKSDEDGYMTWDVEHWSSVDGRRFIRCYSLEGRVLSESTGHNNRRKKFIIRKIEVIDLSLFKSRIDFLMNRAAVYTDFHLIFLCIFLLSRVI